MGMFAWLMCTVLAAAAFNSQGKAVYGFILGLAFGPLGLVYAVFQHFKEREERKWAQFIADSTQRRQRPRMAAMESPLRVCPACHEVIATHLPRCRHCGKDLTLAA